jgi:hypothetical protein
LQSSSDSQVNALLPLLQKLWPRVVTKHKQLPGAPQLVSAVWAQKFFSTVQVS